MIKKCFILIGLYLSVNSLLAQNRTQIGQDINGETTEDIFGSSVSLNSDGSIVVIGAVRNDENGDDSGHARVFQNTDDNWIQI